MEDRIRVEPLPYNTRRRTFGLLLFIFVIAIPILYLYATGYRFDFERPTNLVSTGGMYVAVEKAGAEIFIDDELVRETRTFRKAFYAQNLDVGTHRVHVQKEGHHTWVKELPVSKHLVTEAQAFNMPLMPQVKVFSEWESATGSPVVFETIRVMASTTNEVIATTTKKKSLAFTLSNEYQQVFEYFSTTSTSTIEAGKVLTLPSFLTQDEATTTIEVATTTIMSGHVKLYESDGGLYAGWVGSFEQMPYYYCAEEFPPYSTSTPVTEEPKQKASLLDSLEAEEVENVLHPVQTISTDVECEPAIRISNNNQTLHDFDFFPGSTDLVILVLDDGLYVVEIDDRAWQNVQPLLLGSGLKMHIENSVIYVYDGTLIYQIIFKPE